MLVAKGNGPISDVELQRLRKEGLVSESEYVTTAGDLVVATNAETGSSRILGRTTDLLHEGNKRVLHG